MRVDFFIARRIYFNQKNNELVSRPAVKVAVAGIIIGVAVMLLTIGVVIGFKHEISHKVIGFGGHIQVVNFDNNNTYEMQPVVVDSALMANVRSLEGVADLQRFATKPCMLKTNDSFEGVVLKGVTPEFNWDFFQQHLEEGSLPVIVDSVVSKDVLISRTIANALRLKVDDPIFAYFIQDNVRARKFRVAGIYNTHFSEYDQLMMLGDARQIQQLNQWREDQFSGIEVKIADMARLQDVADNVYYATANRFDVDGNAYYTQTIEDLNPQLFAWLRLLDMNVWVIIFLMLAVAGFNMIAGLLILILEKVNLIGTLKAMGANNALVRKIFLWQAGFLILKGVFWGNLLGLFLCTIQYYFHVIPLDSNAYYVHFVPIAFTWGYWALLNIGTVLISILVLIGPSHMITHISPAKVMRYE